MAQIRSISEGCYRENLKYSAISYIQNIASSMIIGRFEIQIKMSEAQVGIELKG